MDSVVARVEFDEAGNDHESGVCANDCAQEADDEVPESKSEAKLLPHGGS